MLWAKILICTWMMGAIYRGIKATISNDKMFERKRWGLCTIILIVLYFVLIHYSGLF